MEDTAENAHGAVHSPETDDHRTLDEELPPSKLGTKEYVPTPLPLLTVKCGALLLLQFTLLFIRASLIRGAAALLCFFGERGGSGWDSAYEKELEIFKDIGDVGEIWFGEQSMTRVIKWMKKAKVPQNASILDIGTGNGVFLVALADQGYKNLTGIDYSETSVELARNILLAEGQTDATVQKVDFLRCQGELESFDVCIDKGTFDAISFNPDNAKESKRLYVESLKSVLKDEGFFVITSCNWTKEQLLERFKEGFELLEELPTPTFTFGGQTGSSVTALIFRKVH